MRILIVDDDEAICSSLDVILRSEKHEVLTAGEGESGLKILAENPDVELVFLDIKMPGRDGLEILEEVKAKRPELTVVMISAHGTIETAVEATRKGAYDFFEKPFDRGRVLLIARNVAKMRHLQGENENLRLLLSRTNRDMVGKSAAMERLKALINKVAPTTVRVLIMGDNGTGKELVARLLHELSDRRDGPFVDVNCAAIPSELLESELFGHEKGSFTGATEQRKGKFEQADRGTLFLDEVGDMSLEAQAKVLRVIEEQRIQRVGGNRAIPVDVRLVAATNKDLKTDSEEGRFREDLFYRLAVFPILVPPLSERRDDIPLLATTFLSQFAAAAGLKSPVLTDSALKWLAQQPWPGNVRQLRNLMQRCVILQEGDTLDAKDLEGLLGQPAVLGGEEELFRTSATFEEFREKSERLYLLKRLEENDWNIKRTAESIQMQRSNLYKKMERYGLK